jgi:hypothetical protein
VAAPHAARGDQESPAQNTRRKTLAPHPSFIIISGTERQDYANMKYHLISGVKGLGLSIIFSGILAALLILL